LLPVIAIAGCVAWMMLSGSRDAEGQSAPAASPVIGEAQNAAWSSPAVTTEANLATPRREPRRRKRPRRLRCSPWKGRRSTGSGFHRSPGVGRAGSKALVTFTLRNGNDYAVKDVEIACAFIRRDGSHLTDRTRTIHDAVTMKSQRTFARMHVGFVNVHADKAKCSLLAASRL